MFKKLTISGIALVLVSISSLNALAASQSYPWVQSKTNWCWATVAKAMIDTRSGVSVPSSYIQKNSQVGIRTDYCLYSGGIYITDKAQEYIVRTYKEGTNFTDRNEDNLTGSVTELASAVAGMTGNRVSDYGVWKTKPFSNPTTRSTYIDNKLIVDSKEVCGNAYSHAATAKESKGHSLLIVSKPTSSTYKTWNPWTNSYVTYTADQLFSSGFRPAPFTSTTMYIENSIYFDS